VVDNSSPTSTDPTGDRLRHECGTRFEAAVAADGRIERLTELSAAGSRRTLQPFSREGIAVLTRGRNIEYRFDEDQRLRDLPYPEVLAALRQEIVITAHKARHGELLDEPDSLPALRALLRRIDAAEEAFWQACQETPIVGSGGLMFGASGRRQAGFAGSPWDVCRSAHPRRACPHRRRRTRQRARREPLKANVLGRWDN
jgi:hypothetical protein